MHVEKGGMQWWISLTSNGHAEKYKRNEILLALTSPPDELFLFFGAFFIQMSTRMTVIRSHAGAQHVFYI